MTGHFNPNTTEGFETLDVVFQKTCDKSDIEGDVSSIEYLKSEGKLNGNEITVVARSHAYGDAASNYTNQNVDDSKELQPGWTSETKGDAKTEEEKLIAGEELAMRPLLYVGKDLVGDAYESAEGPGSLTKAVGNLPEQVTYEEFMAKTGGSVSKALDWIIWGLQDGSVSLPSVSYISGGEGYKGSYLTNGVLTVLNNPFGTSTSTFTLNAGGETTSKGNLTIGKKANDTSVSKNISVLTDDMTTTYTHTDAANTHTKAAYSTEKEVIDVTDEQGYSTLTAYCDFAGTSQVASSKTAAGTTAYYGSNNKGGEVALDMKTWGAGAVTAQKTASFKFYDPIFYGWMKAEAVGADKNAVGGDEPVGKFAENFTAGQLTSLVTAIKDTAKANTGKYVSVKSEMFKNGEITYDTNLAKAASGDSNDVFFILYPSYGSVTSNLERPNSTTAELCISPKSDATKLNTKFTSEDVDSVDYKIMFIKIGANELTTFKTDKGKGITISGVTEE